MRDPAPVQVAPRRAILSVTATGWVARFPDDVNLRRLFHTDTLPLPWTSCARFEDVAASLVARGYVVERENV